MPQVGRYTSIEPDYSTTRPTRARRPPTRYDDYLRYLMSFEDTRTKKGSSVTQ